MIYSGCASWQLPKSIQPDFPGDGTHLVRYGRQMPAVEINSSFYKHHRHKLYAKWASEVPADFRFAVKMPRELTHDQKLESTEGLDTFLDQVSGLGDKLGVLLLQLPPKLAFDSRSVASFLNRLRKGFDGGIVCEPRHKSWFAKEPDELLDVFEVSRVAADPPPVTGADRPGGWKWRVYYRLHGRPQRFYSAYEDAFLADLASDLHDYEKYAETWCIFNNTASEAGLQNGLQLRKLLKG